MSLPSFASELFADATPLFSEFLPCHVLRVLLPSLRYLLIAPLFRVFELPATLAVFPLNHPNPLLRDIECAVSELGSRMLMQVDASLCVLVQTLSFQSLMVLLLEVPLHHFFVTAGSVRQDSQLFVHRNLLLETIHTLFLHTLQHFVGEVYLATAQFF